jgi:hypothetical protein
MNKFKYLQLVGTLTILIPIAVIAGMGVVYSLPKAPQAIDTTTVPVVLELPKTDTVVIVKEIQKIALPPAIIQKPLPTPIPVSIKDTAEKIAVKLDTAQ